MSYTPISMSVSYDPQAYLQHHAAQQAALQQRHQQQVMAYAPHPIAAPTAPLGQSAVDMSTASNASAVAAAQQQQQAAALLAQQQQAQQQQPPVGYGYYAVNGSGQTVFVPTPAPMAPPPPAGAPPPPPTASTSVLQQLEREFRDIEDRDPSLADGFRVVYDREVPFELRPADSRDHDVGALEGIKVKILTQGEENTQSVSAIRIELTSEADLFFHYTCLINAVGFTQLREDQKLMCEFKEFVVTLLKMCNRCIREPNNFLAVLLLNTDGSASLEFIQNVEYKFIDLLVLPFRESPDHIVRADITYRYNAVRSRLSIMTAKLQDVTALVKVRPGM